MLLLPHKQMFVSYYVCVIYMCVFVCIYVDLENLGNHVDPARKVELVAAQLADNELSKGDMRMS